MDDEQMNKLIAEQLPRAYAMGEACPPPEIWAGVLNGDVTDTQRVSLSEHADSCASCAAERLLAQRFLESDEHTDADVDWIVARLTRQSRDTNVVALPARGQRLVKPLLGLAAAAMLVMAFAPLLPVLRQSGLPETVDFSGVMRGSEIKLVQPVGAIDQVPQQLVWEPVSGADRYRVTLSAVDDEILWRSEFDSLHNTATLPAAINERLNRAVVYYWEVEGWDRDGARIAQPARARFRIEGEAP